MFQERMTICKLWGTFSFPFSPITLKLTHAELSVAPLFAESKEEQRVILPNYSRNTKWVTCVWHENQSTKGRSNLSLCFLSFVYIYLFSHSSMPNHTYLKKSLQGHAFLQWNPSLPFPWTFLGVENRLIVLCIFVTSAYDKMLVTDTQIKWIKYHVNMLATFWTETLLLGASKWCY